MENASKMLQAWNNKDSKTFVDFLTDTQYENKIGYQRIWEKVMAKDSRIADSLVLEKFVNLEKSQQAYFSLQFGNKKSGIVGISHDKGESWCFSQFLGGKFNYSQFKEMFIPELDSAFISFDAEFFNRINFTLGETIKPFEFTDLNDNLIKSENIKGKVIVLNFWSTNCGPCIKEIPHLNNLVEKMKDKNIVFIALASNDNKQNLKDNFLSKHKFIYQIVPIKGNDFNINAFPTHIIIDREQKVVGVFIGASEENLMKLESLLTEIKKKRCPTLSPSINRGFHTLFDGAKVELNIASSITIPIVLRARTCPIRCVANAPGG
ncbi:MAG: TlpA family protein disulfide reductase [Candidatus Atribacteria bacterium]|nr:TlpA family protein disulfide reductase [Candidatus Atribacteria bacterium]